MLRNLTILRNLQIIYLQAAHVGWYSSPLGGWPSAGHGWPAGGWPAGGPSPAAGPGFFVLLVLLPGWYPDV